MLYKKAYGNSYWITKHKLNFSINLYINQIKMNAIFNRLIES